MMGDYFARAMPLIQGKRRFPSSRDPLFFHGLSWFPACGVIDRRVVTAVSIYILKIYNLGSRERMIGGFFIQPSKFYVLGTEGKPNSSSIEVRNPGIPDPFSLIIGFIVERMNNIKSRFNRICNEWSTVKVAIR